MPNDATNQACRQVVKRLIEIGWENFAEPDVQDVLEAARIIEKHEAVEPCNPCSCICAELGFPTECYRLTDVGKEIVCEK